ncbi:MAG: DUF1810 family protein [Oscillospiraceae bacterium]
MNYAMKLNPEPFDAVKAGYKTIELRLNDEKRQKLEIGDNITFHRIDEPSETVTKKITALHHFADFEELFQKLPLLKCGYTPFTWQEAKPEQMESFYSKEQQAKYHVVGIELEEEPLQKYLVGQAGVIPECSSYDKAFQEIQSGRKMTHWIWYTFPQIKGLTVDTVTEFYALQNIKEAQAFLAHPVLGAGLIEITEALLSVQTDDPVAIFGLIDAYKLRSCMTLFCEIAPEQTVFQKVLEKFCRGMKDEDTIYLIK